MKEGRILCLVILLIGSAGCATRSVETRNLSLLKEEILAYVDSGRYAKEVETISRSAANWIERRARNGAREGSGGASRLAVVLDIDETMLSNISHMRTMDFGYLPAAWNEWVDRAEAPAIEPIRELYRHARQLGCEVFFITGRRERERVGTVKNLGNVGVAGYSKIFFKPDESSDSAEKFKTAVRARLVAEGWVIIANIGDQESDLIGGFAEKTFKLPCPFYLSR